MTNEPNSSKRTCGGHGPRYGIAKGPKMTNEANFVVLELEMRIAPRDTAGSAGRDCRVASLLAMTRAGTDPLVSNEPNFW